MTRRKIPENYEANKQKIIQASTDLMVKDSISKFNLNKVADKVGVTNAAIYWYYPSKDALLEEIGQTLYKRYADYASGIANSDISPTDKLRNILTGNPDTYEAQVMGMEKGEFKTELFAYNLTVFISAAIDGLAFQNILISDDTLTLPRSFILTILEKNYYQKGNTTL